MIRWEANSTEFREPSYFKYVSFSIFENFADEPFFDLHQLTMVTQ